MVMARASARWVTAMAKNTGGPLTATASLNAAGAGPSFAVHLADVAVDEETGETTILRYTAAQDAGTAIHPSYVEGQIQGGSVQGIGWALNEEYIYDSDGVMENAGFLDYRMVDTDHCRAGVWAIVAAGL